MLALKGFGGLTLTVTCLPWSGALFPGVRPARLFRRHCSLRGGCCSCCEILYTARVPFSHCRRYRTDLILELLGLHKLRLPLLADSL
jgi:hypothetical protein